MSTLQNGTKPTCLSRSLKGAKNGRILVLLDDFTENLKLKDLISQFSLCTFVVSSHSQYFKASTEDILIISSTLTPQDQRDVVRHFMMKGTGSLVVQKSRRQELEKILMDLFRETSFNTLTLDLIVLYIRDRLSHDPNMDLTFTHNLCQEILAKQSPMERIAFYLSKIDKSVVERFKVFGLFLDWPLSKALLQDFWKINDDGYNQIIESFRIFSNLWVGIPPIQGESYYTS
jgi:hypothetical protein